MRIVWDPPKRQANLDERQLDFEMVTPAFFEAAIVLPAKKGRWVAIGRIGGRPYSVIFHRLGREGVSIVSLRVASRKERRVLP